MRIVVATALSIAALLGAAQATSQVMREPPRVDERQGLDALVAENTVAAARIVGYWRSRSPVGAPRSSLPDRFEIHDNYARFISEEDRRTMQRRLRAVVDHVLSQPSLQGPDVEVFIDPPELSRRSSATPMTLLLTFRVRADGREAPLRIALGTASLPESERVVGRTAGGCVRSQSLTGATRGVEFYHSGPPAQASRSHIGPVLLLGGSLSFHDSPSFDILAALPASRVTAAIQTLDCEALYALANTG